MHREAPEGSCLAGGWMRVCVPNLGERVHSKSQEQRLSEEEDGRGQELATSDRLDRLVL